MPVGNPTISGSPVVGQTLTCISGGFINGPESLAWQWLRNGAPIAGATGPSYVPTAADVGRGVACHMAATNSEGTGDATSESLIVSPAPAAPATPQGSVLPATATQPATLSAKATCKLAKSRKAVTCTITRLTPKSSTATLFGTARLQNTKKSVTKSASKGSVKVTVRSTKTIKKGTKVVLKVRSGNTIRIYTVKAS